MRRLIEEQIDVGCIPVNDRLCERKAFFHHAAELGRGKFQRFHILQGLGDNGFFYFKPIAVIDRENGSFSVKGEDLPVPLLVVDAGQGQPGQDVIDRREGLSRCPQTVSLFKGTPSPRNRLKKGFNAEKSSAKIYLGVCMAAPPFWTAF